MSTPTLPHRWVVQPGNHGSLLSEAPDSSKTGVKLQLLFSEATGHQELVYLLAVLGVYSGWTHTPAPHSLSAH